MYTYYTTHIIMKAYTENDQFYGINTVNFDYTQRRVGRQIIRQNKSFDLE